MSSPVRPPLTVTEVDGTPTQTGINKIIVSNGTLSISSDVATIDTTGTGGSGTVTSVASSDLFISITNPSTTPSISIAAASTLTGGYLTASDWDAFSAKGDGTVTSVTSTSPISVATGTTTPALTISQSDSTTDGYLSSTDWALFNAKGSGDGTVTSVASSDLFITITDSTTTPSISIAAASTLTGGYLTSSDWDAFSAKGDGTVTSVTSTSPISVATGTTTPALTISKSDSTTDGYLSSTDWALFNAKGSGDGTVTSVTSSSPISVTTGTTTPALTISQSDSTTDGYLSSTDWALFNAKGSGDGTVTSITPAADSGTGTAITTSGSLTFTGGTNVTTSVTGTTVTIDASGGSAGGSDGELQYNNSGTFGGLNYVKRETSGGYEGLALGSAAAGLITTQGSFDLKLDTNVGVDSGKIVITDGVDGDISLTPDGAGAVEISGAYKLPTAVTGTTGYVLTANTDGTTSWAAAGGGGGSAGGSTTEIQYNDGGAFAGSTVMTFDNTATAEQILFTGSSSTALLKIENAGAGSVVEIHDDASDTNYWIVDQYGRQSIKGPISAGYDLTVAGAIKTSGIKTSAGSAAAPQITFHSDTNTGMYSPAADTIGFATGGVLNTQIGQDGGITEIIIYGQSGNSSQITTDAGTDLFLTTSRGTDSGKILINSGVDGDISLTPDGAGAVEISGAYKLPTAVTGTTGYVLTANTDGTTSWAAAGGGSGIVGVLPQTGSTTANQYNVGSTPPWGTGSSSTQALNPFDKPVAYPFIAPETGTVSAIGVNVSTDDTQGLYVGIYSQDANNLPSTRLGYAIVSLGATGDSYQSTITGTISLTAGEQYWYSLNTDAVTYNAVIVATDRASLTTLGLTTTLSKKVYALEDASGLAHAAPPATFVTDTFQDGYNRPHLGLKF